MSKRKQHEILNETPLSSLSNVRTVLANWWTEYNGLLPYSQIDWQTLAEFASTFIPRRALALRDA